MRSEPEPRERIDDDADDSQFDDLKGRVSDFHGYDEAALEQYRTLSYYFYLRSIKKESLPVAAAMTCEAFGHDAPRGMCRRCGLGVDLADESKKRERRRDAQRQAFLASRHRY